jgi:hypothetical protein
LADQHVCRRELEHNFRRPGTAAASLGGGLGPTVHLIRKKRSDTLICTLRDEYGPNFAKGYRSDAQLGTVLKKAGLESLDQPLDRSR